MDDVRGDIRMIGGSQGCTHGTLCSDPSCTKEPKDGWQNHEGGTLICELDTLWDPYFKTNRQGY
jgi:hypothetical protein